MIANWMCLFVYLKYEFGSTYLFLFVRITNLLSAYCVRGPFVQTSLYVSWKFWVGGNLNIINESRNHKKGWDQIFKFQWGKQKGQEHDFWLKVSGGKTLEETMILICQKWGLVGPVQEEIKLPSWSSIFHSKILHFQNLNHYLSCACGLTQIEIS